jgi:hypothetical protein
MWRGEKSCPYQDSNSDPSAVQPVANLERERKIKGRQERRDNGKKKERNTEIQSKEKRTRDRQSIIN